MSNNSLKIKSQDILGPGWVKFYRIYIHGDCGSPMMMSKFAWPTVDGRNPKQPPGMVLKPCK